MRGLVICGTVLSLFCFLGCEDGGVSPSDGGTEAGTDAAPDAPVDAADGGMAVYSIDLDPLELGPSFSPSIHDYYVRCAAGDNVATLTVVDSNGTQTSTVHLVENQLLTVDGDYYIRCLPHDFPVIAVQKYPQVGLPTPGYYLVNSSTYAVVMDTNGTPIWYQHGSSTANVDAQRKNEISFIPNAVFPFGWNTTEKMDLHAIDTLTTTSVQAVGVATDAHEFQIMANGDYLMLTFPIANHVNLTGLGTFGADENMADCEIQEVDTQGNLVWSWLGSDHMDAVQESLEPSAFNINNQSVVDPFHCNAIDIDSSGNLLLSVRHTNAVYYIDRSTGTIQWKLGGTSYNKDSAAFIQVTSDSQTTFNMQHDARFGPNGDVSMFDDHGADKGTSKEKARGVEYSLDHNAGTAAVVFQFLGSAEALYEGSFRRYADGDSVIGWGYVPGDPRVVTEVNANAEDVLDIWYIAAPATSAVSYRAIKVPTSQLDIDLLRSSAAK
jgi:hypothetical protein